MNPAKMYPPSGVSIRDCTQSELLPQMFFCHIIFPDWSILMIHISFPRELSVFSAEISESDDYEITTIGSLNY
jgi:hypothetical protein